MVVAQLIKRKAQSFKVVVNNALFSVSVMVSISCQIIEFWSIDILTINHRRFFGREKPKKYKTGSKKCKLY
ncbi:hypothetical protein A3766_20200 [Oleiphilus sp. HI0132]|nr:hypothetical protein A3766_20200 [Oleiphilus sp. HI0132]